MVWRSLWNVTSGKSGLSEQRLVEAYAEAALRSRVHPKDHGVFNARKSDLIRE
jgi:hypothetical protein